MTTRGLFLLCISMLFLVCVFTIATSIINTTMLCVRVCLFGCACVCLCVCVCVWLFVFRWAGCANSLAFIRVSHMRDFGAAFYTPPIWKQHILKTTTHAFAISSGMSTKDFIGDGTPQKRDKTRCSGSSGHGTCIQNHKFGSWIGIPMARKGFILSQDSTTTIGTFC